MPPSPALPFPGGETPPHLHGEGSEDEWLAPRRWGKLAEGLKEGMKIVAK